MKKATIASVIAGMSLSMLQRLNPPSKGKFYVRCYSDCSLKLGINQKLRVAQLVRFDENIQAL